MFRVKKAAVSLITTVLLGFIANLSGATLNVPSAPYPTIQSAIDAAGTGDKVVVATGTYYENIDFMGKDITVKSTEPDDPEVVANTIIAGNSIWPVVSFDGTETASSKLTGFTITRDPNLIAHWKLDESSGNEVSDSAGNHDGTTVNNPVWQPSGGQVAGALQFHSDTDKYVSISGYKGVTGNKARSITAWIKVTSAGNIVHWGSLTDTGGKWTFMVNGTTSWNAGVVGAIRMAVQGGRIVGTKDLRDNTWHHVAVTFEEGGTLGDISLYVDGVEEIISYIQTPSLVINTSLVDEDVIIGNLPGYTSSSGIIDYVSVTGLIDDVRIYDKALNNSEIAKVHESGFEWTSPVHFPELNDGSNKPTTPWVSAEGLTIYFARMDSAKGHKCLFKADRNNIGDSFRNVTRIDELIPNDPNDNYYGQDMSAPRLSDDRLRLYYHHHLAAGKSNIKMAELDTVNDRWVDTITFNNLAGGSNASLTSDEKTILYHKLTDQQSFNLFAATRSSTSSDFTDNSGIVTGINSDLSDNGPSITGSGSTIYFGSTNRDGIPTHNFYKSYWDYSGIGERIEELIKFPGYETKWESNLFISRNEYFIYFQDSTGIWNMKNKSLRGGGIYGKGTKATISNCLVTGNTAETGGGLYQCNGLIDNCTISDNSAITGGGIAGCTGTISNTLFKDNFAEGNSSVYMYGFYAAGGAIYNDENCDPNIINCTFLNNSGGSKKSYGMAGSAIVNNCSSPRISGCTFIENVLFGDSGGGGGAVFNYDSSTIIINCVFMENSVLSGNSYGGAIYSNNSNIDQIPGKPVITNCVFSWNTSNSGGAIYNNYCDSQITNCVFTNNFSDFAGSGIDNNYSNPIIKNCTFSGNYGNHVINNSYSNPEIINSILWNNTYPQGESTTSNARVKNCCINGSFASGTWDTSLGTDLGGNIDADPNFVNSVDPAGSDGIFGTLDDGLIPGFGAACIDAGSDANIPAGTNFDITGRSRISDGDHDGAATVDMGAYELPRVYFVNASVAGGADDGTSWQDAFDTLQEALTASSANSGDEIWVAKGTYTPGTSVTDSFVMKAGVDLYGGFDGMDGNGFAGPAGMPRGFVRRNIENNATMLSGNIGATNSYHVVKGANNAKLDGFTVEGGDATNDPSNGSGGGIYCNSTSTVISNCNVKNNSAYTGGGIYGTTGNVTSCLINFNSAVNNSGINGNGGGLALCDGKISNCFITQNTAYASGAALYDCDGDIVNNTIVSNSAGTLDAGISYCNGSISSCIIWDNTPGQLSNSSIPEFSCIKDWTGISTNIADDPLFVDALNYDYHLQPQSPCINGGNLIVSDANGLDFDGQPRIMDYTVDMGADECPIVWYVDANVITAGDGDTWTAAFDNIQDALNICERFAGHEIWVAVGTYKPSLQTDPGDPNTATFQLLDGVSIYGGFDGTEARRSDRSSDPNLTILSGDTGTAADTSDNCYHVVTGSGVGLKTKLDGFTITHGNAGSETVDEYICGGGMYNYLIGPTVANCIFEGNHAKGAPFYGDSSKGGGAVCNKYSKPHFLGCIFDSNSSLFIGGGIFNNRSFPYLNNCSFNANKLIGDDWAPSGGAICNEYSSPLLFDCSFIGNKAEAGDTHGGAIYNNVYSSPILVYCDFINNFSYADSGAVENHSYCHATFIGCDFEDNVSQAGTGGMRISHHSDVTLINCVFNGNMGGRIGALSNYSCDPLLINCTFSNNGTLDGILGGTVGGMYNSGNPTLINCKFSGNTCSDDLQSSFKHVGGMVNHNAVTVLTNCTFENNHASGNNGIGAMYNYLPIGTPDFWSGCNYFNNLGNLASDYYNIFH